MLFGSSSGALRMMVGMNPMMGMMGGMNPMMGMMNPMMGMLLVRKKPCVRGICM